MEAIINYVTQHIATAIVIIGLIIAEELVRHLVQIVSGE